MKRALSAVLTFILLAATALGYGLPGAQAEPVIQFVLPDGYVGAFRLVLDEQDGLDIKFEDGRYRLDIPAGGTLKLRSFKFFAQWHSKTAVYQSGKEIPPGSFISSMSGSDAFHDVFMVVGDIDEKGEMKPPVVWTYMIGTKRQADELKRRLNREAEKLKRRYKSGGA